MTDERIACRRATSVDELLDLRARVLRPGLAPERTRFAGDDDPTTRHWVATRDDEVVCCVSVMAASDPGGSVARFQLRGMATADVARNLGIGRRLLDLVHAEVGEAMWCNARVRAASFYERAGWIRTSDVFEIEGVGPHYRMVFVPSGGVDPSGGRGDASASA